MRYLPLFLIALVSGGMSADSGTVSKGIYPTALTAIYDRPISGGLPISYLETTDLCRIDSTWVDNENVEWVFVRTSSRSGWLQKTALKVTASAIQVRPEAAAAGSKSADLDAKRRYRIVEQHPEWERRIVKAVREGKICLDMTEEQLIASWGDPLQKNGAFISGGGKQNIWLFRGPSGKYEMIFMAKGKIVGWSD